MGSEQHTDLPMGSHTQTTSTHHCGKWCGTTWRGPERLRNGPCSRDKATVLCPVTQSLIRMQQHSNAASCCLHLHKHTNKMHDQIWLIMYYMSHILLIITFSFFFTLQIRLIQSIQRVFRPFTFFIICYAAALCYNLLSLFFLSLIYTPRPTWRSLRGSAERKGRGSPNPGLQSFLRHSKKTGGWNRCQRCFRWVLSKGFCILSECTVYAYCWNCLLLNAYNLPFFSVFYIESTL